MWPARASIRPRRPSPACKTSRSAERHVRNAARSLRSPLPVRAARGDPRMTTVVQTPGATQPQGNHNFIAALEIDTRLLAMAAALVVIWVGLDVLTGGIFLTARNLWNLSVQTSVVGIMATGMVLVIITRHIDLSVGSVLGFVG